MALFPNVRAALAAAIVAAGLAIPTAASADATTEILLVLGGTIADAAHTEYAEDAADGAIPQLPIVYDEERNN